MNIFYLSFHCKSETNFNIHEPQVNKRWNSSDIFRLFLHYSAKVDTVSARGRKKVCTAAGSLNTQPEPLLHMVCGAVRIWSSSLNTHRGAREHCGVVQFMYLIKTFFFFKGSNRLSSLFSPYEHHTSSQ